MKILPTLLLLVIGTGGIDPDQALLTGGDFHRDFVVVPAGVQGLELWGEGGWMEVPQPALAAGQMLLIVAHPETQEGIQEGAPFPPLVHPLNPAPRPDRHEFRKVNRLLRVAVPPTPGGRKLLELRWGHYGLRVRMPPGGTVRLLDCNGCHGIGIQPRAGEEGAWPWDLLVGDACPPSQSQATVQSIEREGPYLLAIVNGYADHLRHATTPSFERRAVP
jgi:hypothetical protein